MTSFSDVTNRIDVNVGADDDDDATDDVLPELDAASAIRPPRRFFRSKSSVLSPPRRYLEGASAAWRRNRSMSTGATPAEEALMSSSPCLSSSNPNCSGSPGGGGGGRRSGVYVYNTPPRSPRDLTSGSHTFPRDSSESHTFPRRLKSPSLSPRSPSVSVDSRSPSASPIGHSGSPRGPSHSPRGPSASHKSPSASHKGPSASPKGPSASPKGPSASPKSPSGDTQTPPRSPHRWSVSSSPDLFGRRTRTLSSASLTSTSSSCLSSPGDLDPTSPTSPPCRRWSTMTMWSGAATPNIVRCISKDEYLYRLVLQTVVSPLGAPETRVGFRPTELANHLRQVFDVDQEYHDKWLREVKYSKPSNIALNVTVVEAQGLKPMDRNGLSDPYCIICLAHPRTKTPRGSPRSSPQLARRRRSSYEHSDMKKTQTIKATLNPKWNEEFELDVQDLQAEELHVYIWDCDEGTTTPDLRNVDKYHSPLRSLIRQIRPTGKPTDDFLGQFRVPVKDIPAAGFDKWFELYEDRKQKLKAPGRCRLRLQLSIKQEVSQLDSVESDQCSIEDFYCVTRQIYQHACRQVAQEAPEDEEGVLKRLPAQSRSIFDQFSVQHHFSKITQILIELVVVLELASDTQLGVVISERLIQDNLVNMEMEWVTLNAGNHGDSVDHTRSHITNMELALLDRAASSYVERCISGMDNIPVLFPPVQLKIEQLNANLKLLVNLLNLHIWSQNDNARKDLSTILCERLQSDVRKWANSKLEEVRSSSKDPVLQEVKQLVKVINEAITSLTPIYSRAQYFNRIGLDYFKVASVALESKLATKAQSLMLSMDHYQLRYQKFSVNIRESSTISLQLYMALRNLLAMVRTNIGESPRDLFRLTVSNYQSWFENAVIFWLQTFKEECTQRMERALVIDKDFVRVTSLVKYSNSSVDVLTNFSKITSEWRQIGFSDADIGVLGVTKITDTICDGARQYVERLKTILEKNCYYDANNNSQFDVTEQLCITLNNIEHVRQYLDQLSELLNFEVICQNMSVKHEDEQVGKQSLNALNRLVQSAHEDIHSQGLTLLYRITERMTVELKKYTERFTQCNPDKKSSVDPLLAYLEQNIQVLYERLETSIFPLILQQIWEAAVTCFDDSLLSGKPCRYYEDMYSHLRSLRAYFHRGGVEEELLDKGQFVRLVHRLQMNAKSSEELMLNYFTTLVEDMNTPIDYHGHLAIKAGYMNETGGNATVYIQVVGGQSLPAVTRKGTCDPFVTVSLCPESIYQRRGYKTHVVHNSTHPTFNSSFQFPGIPCEYLEKKGAVVLLTVWHMDNLLPCNDMLGEVLVSIMDIPQMTTRQTIDDMPALLLSLKQPMEPESGPFKILQERCSWCVLARKFIAKRRVTAGYVPAVQLCTPMKLLLNKVRGRKHISRTATESSHELPS